jgi:hypothetical protein
MDAGPLEEMMQVALDSMTVAETMAVLNGDWSPLERVHPMLLAYVTNQVLQVCNTIKSLMEMMNSWIYFRETRLKSVLIGLLMK